MEVGGENLCFEGVGVSVLGRNELEALSQQRFEPGTYVISITDTDAPLVRLQHQPQAILRLTFDDVGDEEYPIGCHVMEDADSEDEDVIALISSCITDEQAAHIATFVQTNLANMEYLIVSCEMGQSRSAAVAAAIVEHYTNRPCAIYNDKRFYPNELVYHKVKDAMNSGQR